MLVRSELLSSSIIASGQKRLFVKLEYVEFTKQAASAAIVKERHQVAAKTQLYLHERYARTRITVKLFVY
jgi:hypothetical protein